MLSGREPEWIPVENKSTNTNEVRFLINLCLSAEHTGWNNVTLSLFLFEGRCFILSAWSSTLMKPRGSQSLQYFHLSDEVREKRQQSSRLLWMYWLSQKLHRPYTPRRAQQKDEWSFMGTAPLKVGDSFQPKRWTWNVIFPVHQTELLLKSWELCWEWLQNQGQSASGTWVFYYQEGV